jgi:hypothetical protein
MGVPIYYRLLACLVCLASLAPERSEYSEYREPNSMRVDLFRPKQYYAV